MFTRAFSGVVELNADLWPHVWVFRWWAAWISSVGPVDILNPNACLEALEDS